MNLRRTSGTLLAIGLLIVAVSWLWPAIAGRGLLWDDAKAAEFSQAAESLHESIHAHAHEHGHKDGDVHTHGDHSHEDAHVVAASHKYLAAKGELESAQFWSRTFPVYLRWIGVAVCAIGVGGYLKARSE